MNFATIPYKFIPLTTTTQQERIHFLSHLRMPTFRFTKIPSRYQIDIVSSSSLFFTYHNIEISCFMEAFNGKKYVAVEIKLWWWENFHIAWGFYIASLDIWLLLIFIVFLSRFISRFSHHNTFTPTLLKQPLPTRCLLREITCGTFYVRSL